MKVMVNSAFQVAILWILISVVAATHYLNFKGLKYDLSNSNSSDVIAISSEDTVEDNGKEDLSTARSSASQTSGSFVAAAAKSSAVPRGTSSSPLESTTSPLTATLNADDIHELNRILEQTSMTSDSPELSQVTTRLTNIPKTQAPFPEFGTVDGSSTEDTTTNATLNSTTSAPDVVLKKKGRKTYIDDIFKQSLAWLGDTYTLSIMVPILAGFLFAIVIIITLLTFTCIRRRCRRRRLRRKILPDSIRKMGPSDRARLLAETSDEEF